MTRYDSFSQYNEDFIGIAIMDGGNISDPDDLAVRITIIRQDDLNAPLAVVDNEAATRDSAGLYSFNITPLNVTAIKADYIATWTYSVTGNPRSFEYRFMVVDPQPYFDSLDFDQRTMVSHVYHKVSDAFDSMKGGPYLWELPQSHFNFETVAQLMVVDAMTYLNFASPKAFIPPFTLGIGSAKPFPVGWYGLVERATMYELFKHLATSYLEIPLPEGVNVAYLNRRDYYERWMQRADHEKEELDHMVKMLKRDMRFGVMSRSLLLAGGIFPVSYLNPARPRWPYQLSRFF